MGFKLCLDSLASVNGIWKSLLKKCWQLLRICVLLWKITSLLISFFSILERKKLSQFVTCALAFYTHNLKTLFSIFPSLEAMISLILVLSTYPFIYLMTNVGVLFVCLFADSVYSWHILSIIIFICTLNVKVMLHSCHLANCICVLE